MSENLGRAFAGAAALAGLWIAVYWWWEPTPSVSRAASRVPSTISPVGSASGSGATGVSPPPSMPAPGPAPARATEVASPLPPAVVPPRFRDYTVRNGDTLRSIAERELGASKWAEAISRANPLADVERLRPGRVIRIPLDPTNIQGKPSVPTAPTPTAASPSQAVAPPPTPPAPTVPQAETTYLVRRGDTLSGIAKARYGSASLASLIAKANGLADEDALREGQKLLIPPKP